MSGRQSMEKKTNGLQNERRLYVLIDKSLDPVYGCVQGGHCIANFIKDFPNQWNNEYLIYLYADVEYWMHKLDKLNIDYSYFIEPDLNKITSLAILNHKNLFRELNLVK